MGKLEEQIEEGKAAIAEHLFESEGNSLRVGLFAILVLLFIVITASILFWRVVGIQSDIGIRNTSGVAVIMVSLPLDHPNTPGVLNAITLAFEEINFKIHTTNLELQIFDTGSNGDVLNEEQELRNATLAAENDNVVAYIGPWYSANAKVSMPILNRAGIVQITPVATWPGLTKTGFGPGEPGLFFPSGTRHFFRISTDEEQQGSRTAVWIEALEQASIYIVDDGKIEGKAVTDLFEHRALKRELQIVGHTTLGERPGGSIEELLVDITEQETNIVYFGGEVSEDSIAFIRALRQELPEVLVVGSQGIKNQVFIDRIGKDLAEGIYATTFGVPASLYTTQRGADFREAYVTRFEQEPTETSVFGYEAARALIHAIRASETNDREAILQALNTTEQFIGVFGPWSFDEHGDSTLDLVSAHIVEDGKYEFIGELGR